mgnify:FL=1
MKTLSFIGSSGFIGKSFIDYLNRVNGSFLNIKKLYLFQRSKKKLVSKKIETIFKIEDFKKIKKIPETDYIIYAIKSNSITEAKIIFKNFKKILKKLNKKPKIIFLSSGAIYGKYNNKIKLYENNKIYKKNIFKLSGVKKKYAKEKIFLENEFIKLARNGYNTSIARCFTFYGKYIVKYNYAISDILKSIKENKNVILNNKGNTYRSFMHADDMSIWILNIMNRSSEECPTVNIGSDQAMSIKKLALLLIKKFNPKIKIIFDKNSKKYNDYYVPSIYLAKRELKLTISKNIKNIIKEDIF